MKKAIFIGYKHQNDFYKLKKGKEYEVKSACGYEYVIDDSGLLVPFGGIYDTCIFKLCDSICDSDNIKEPPELKYFINGNLVTKGYFYESLGEVNEADRLGVKVLSIKFEIKFE